MWQITWILSFLPDWFWTLVLFAGAAAVAASWLLKFIPFVGTYKLPLQICGILAVVIGVYFQGVIANEAKWQAKIAELEAQIKIAEEKSKEVNTVVETKVVTKTKVIKERGAEIVKYVDKIIDRVQTVEVEKACPIPKEVIDVHNEASQMNKIVEQKNKEIKK
jgi:hypothetical protein